MDSGSIVRSLKYFCSLSSFRCKTFSFISSSSYRVQIARVFGSIACNFVVLGFCVPYCSTLKTTPTAGSFACVSTISFVDQWKFQLTGVGIVSGVGIVLVSMSTSMMSLILDNYSTMDTLHVVFSALHYLPSCVQCQNDIPEVVPTTVQPGIVVS